MKTTVMPSVEEDTQRTQTELWLEQEFSRLSKEKAPMW